MLGEDFLGLHQQRHARGVGGYEGIAVAVAADPGTELDEAGDLDHRVAILVFAVNPGDRALEMAVVDFHRVEQAALKIVQPHLDLVGHARLAAAHLVGQPQGFDL